MGSRAPFTHLAYTEKTLMPTVQKKMHIHLPSAEEDDATLRTIYERMLEVCKEEGADVEFLEGGISHPNSVLNLLGCSIGPYGHTETKKKLGVEDDISLCYFLKYFHAAIRSLGYTQEPMERLFERVSSRVDKAYLA
jgi:hypothetical protein